MELLFARSSPHHEDQERPSSSSKMLERSKSPSHISKPLKQKIWVVQHGFATENDRRAFLLALPIILDLVWKINKRCLSFRNTSCYHKKSTRISRGTTSGSIWKINKSCLTVTWRCPVLFIFQWVCKVSVKIKQALFKIDAAVNSRYS